MYTYQVRTAPAEGRSEITTFETLEEARAFANENALYGGLVTDSEGALVYAPFGEVGSTLMYHAKCICDHIRDNEFIYGHAPINPAFNHDARTVSCDRLVDWILFKAGYTDQPYIHGKCVEGPGLTDWCVEHGFEKIASVDDLHPGDVVFTRATPAGHPGHTFMHAGASAEEGMYYRYDAGKLERIRSTQPSCEPLCDFMYAYRAPRVERLGAV